MLILQNKFYWISNRSGVVELIQTVTKNLWGWSRNRFHSLQKATGARGSADPFTLILPISHLEAQQLMTSHITSHKIFKTNLWYSGASLTLACWTKTWLACMRSISFKLKLLIIWSGLTFLGPPHEVANSVTLAFDLLIFKCL